MLSGSSHKSDFVDQRQAAKSAISLAQSMATISKALMPVALVMRLFGAINNEELNEGSDAEISKKLINDIGKIYGFDNSEISFHDIEQIFHYVEMGAHVIGNFAAGIVLHSPFFGYGINALRLKSVGTLAIMYFEYKCITGEVPTREQIYYYGMH